MDADIRKLGMDSGIWDTDGWRVATLADAVSGPTSYYCSGCAMRLTERALVNIDHPWAYWCGYCGIARRQGKGLL